MAIGSKYKVLPFLGADEWYIHNQQGYARHGTLIIRTGILAKEGQAWTETWFFWADGYWTEIWGDHVFVHCHSVTEFIRGCDSLETLRMVYPFVKEIPREAMPK